MESIDAFLQTFWLVSVSFSCGVLGTLFVVNQRAGR